MNILIFRTLPIKESKKIIAKLIEGDKGSKFYLLTKEGSRKEFINLGFEEIITYKEKRIGIWRTRRLFKEISNLEIDRIYILYRNIKEFCNLNVEVFVWMARCKEIIAYDFSFNKRVINFKIIISHTILYLLHHLLHRVDEVAVDLGLNVLLLLSKLYPNNSNRQMRQKRILHLPVNWGGQAYLLAKTMRRLNYFSQNMVKEQNWIEYPSDIILNHKSKHFKNLILLNFFLKALFKYNIFHYHTSNTLFGDLRELKILKNLGKRIIVHFRGCDIREREVIREKYTYNVCKYCESYCPSGDRIKTNMINVLADVTFITTPDLLEFSPNSILMPNAVDLRRAVSNPQKNGKEILIVHSPTAMDIKGTKFIAEAVERVVKEYKNVEFKLIEKTPHDEAIKIYQRADIAIDQLFMGAFANFAIEMMAFGVPVLCYIREDLEKYYKDCPVVRVTKDNLYGKIVELIENKELRERIGKESRKYVEEVHDSIKVANRILQYYDSPMKVGRF